MEFKGIPSYASEYEFVVCFKDEESEPDTYYFYTAAESEFWAEQACKEVKESNCNWKPIVIHNVRM